MSWSPVPVASPAATRIARDGVVVSYAEVLGLWQADRDFVGFFSAALRGAPWPAFRWETPPITTRTATLGTPRVGIGGSFAPFQGTVWRSRRRRRLRQTLRGTAREGASERLASSDFRMLEPPCLRSAGAGPELLVAPDPRPFRDHLPPVGSDAAVAFASLGRDAMLVVPAPPHAGPGYPHVGEFVRTAPLSAQAQLWARVGAEAQARLSARPLWISTAGAGVAWLHVRLDDRPKYYRTAAYRGEAG